VKAGRTFAAVIVSCLWSGFVVAASGASVQQNPLPVAGQPTTVPTATAATPILTGVADEPLRLELANATAKLASLESSIAKAGDKADQVASRTSMYSLLTVLGTALLTAALSLVAQWMLMRHQRRINRADSEAKVANTYVEWQLKQLSELYGPIRALLGQSNVLYRQMNRALVAREPKKFRLIPGDDFDGQEFQICLNGTWQRFRTVKHLDEVYDKTFGIEPYFQDVLDVGSRMADVIREKAGFVRPEDDALVKVMGEYLAHYLVLDRLHDRAKKGEKLHLNAADEHATFPNRIQELVDNGFKAINEQVMEWRDFKASRKSIGDASSATVTFYDNNAERYAWQTAQADLSELYARFLPLVKTGGRILDVGCGGGRDLREFKTRGFRCVGVDPAPRLAQFAREFSECKVVVGKAEDLPFFQEFDGVWACASLLHIDRAKLKVAMERISLALAVEGVLFLSMQAGAGHSKGEDGRFYERYSAAELKAIVDSSGFAVLDQWSTQDTLPGRGAMTWLNLLAKKTHLPSHL
jgi:SAM-dependent methyltransferase